MLRPQLRHGLIVGMISLLSISGLWAQICTPDEQFTEAGLFPEVLPSGEVGMAYEATATAVLPHTLDVGVGILDICKGRILNTEPNLADYGLAYECNVANCVIEIDHTTSNTLTYACLVIAGTPTQPLDSVKVILQAVVGNVDNGGVCDSTLAVPETLTVALEITPSTSIASPAGDGSGQLHAFQPSPDRLLVGYTLAQAQATELTLIDQQGREIYRRERLREVAGPQTQPVALGAWPSGVYLLRLSLPEQGAQLTRRVIITR